MKGTSQRDLWLASTSLPGVGISARHAEVRPCASGTPETPLSNPFKQMKCADLELFGYFAKLSEIFLNFA